MINKKKINIVSASTTTQGVQNLRIKTVSKQTANQAIVRPTEHTSIGGIAVGNKNAGRNLQLVDNYLFLETFNIILCCKIFYSQRTD